MERMRSADSPSHLRSQIRDEVMGLWVLDAHEHLHFPDQHAEHANDCFYLTNHYLNADLVSAGMPEETMQRLVDPSVPLDLRWMAFEPFWEVSRTTGYGQAVERAVRDLYGLPGLTASTYQELSIRVAETAGEVSWYEQVLKRNGRFIASLMDVGSTRGDRRYFLPVMRVDRFIVAGKPSEFADAVTNGPSDGRDAPANMAAYLKALDDLLGAYRSEGMIALKCGLAYRRSLRFETVDRATASSLYDQALRGGLSPSDAGPLQDFLFHEVCDRASALHLPYQVHTGLQAGNWGADIVITNPAFLTNTLKAHPGTTFDLFHGGYPYGGELASLAKNFPNAYINACWLAIISPTVLRRCLHEWLDTVPHNKIQAFGGDYRMPELAYAHGQMAREAVADVLADRVEAGWLAEADASALANRLLRDNGLKLFAIDDEFVKSATAPIG